MSPEAGDLAGRAVEHVDPVETAAEARVVAGQPGYAAAGAVTAVETFVTFAEAAVGLTDAQALATAGDA